MVVSGEVVFNPLTAEFIEPGDIETFREPACLCLTVNNMLEVFVADIGFCRHDNQVTGRIGAADVEVFDVGEHLCTDSGSVKHKEMPGLYVH